MNLLFVTVPDDFNLFLYGDDHMGTTLRYDKGFDRMVEMINSEYEGVKKNLAVDHGDIVEGIKIDDKRFLPEISYDDNQRHILLPSPSSQKEEAMAVRLPFKDKIITVLEGNHPLKLWRDEFITPWVCNKLNVPFGTWTAKITFKDKKGRLLFKHFCCHGTRTITSTADDPSRRKNNMELILKRLLKYLAGDCLLMSQGDTHKLLIRGPEKELYLGDDGKEITQHYTEAEPTVKYIHPDMRWYVNSGSFRRKYNKGLVPDYTEMRGYPPIELGFAIAKIRDRKLIGIDKVVV